MKERTGYYWDVMAWRNSRRVRAMDHITRAIYREVMDEIWINGGVPNELGAIALLTGWPIEDVTRCWPTIHDCLVPTKKNPDLFTSERLEEERQKRNSISKKRKQAADEKWKRNANGMQLHSKSTASAMQEPAIQVQEQVLVTSTSRKRAKKPETDPPAELPITDSMRQWALADGFTEDDIQRETPKMLDHFRAKGEKKSDWEATWRNWLRKHKEFKGSNGNGTHRGDSNTNTRAAQAGLGFSPRPYTPKQ